MNEPDVTSRCRDCGGVGIFCSSLIGCLEPPFATTKTPVDVAYAAGVDDERTRWVEELTSEVRAWDNGEDTYTIILALRALVTKATAPATPPAGQ